MEVGANQQRNPPCCSARYSFSRIGRQGGRLHDRLKKHAERFTGQLIGHPRRRFHNLLRRKVVQELGIAAWRKPQLSEQRSGDLLRLLRRQALGGTALHDRACEQAACSRHRQQCSDAHTASGFPKNGNALRIPAEGGNIALYPFQGSNLVQEASIGGKVPAKWGQMQKSEWSQPVIHCNQNDVAVTGHAGTVEHRLASSPGHKGPPVYPDHHRQALPGFGRRPDIQI
ncbi:hypothetical protein D3C73_617210 [compost metagenome]